MLIPVIVMLCGGGYAYRRLSKPSGMTPERQRLYDNAMTSLSAPNLRKLAIAFRSEGLTKEADMLNKRANLRDSPDDVKLGRRELKRKAMKSKDPVKVEALASAFKSIGAEGCAASLQKHADTLKKIEGQ